MILTALFQTVQVVYDVWKLEVEATQNERPLVAAYRNLFNPRPLHVNQWAVFLTVDLKYCTSYLAAVCWNIPFLSCLVLISLRFKETCCVAL